MHQRGSFRALSVLLATIALAVACHRARSQPPASSPDASKPAGVAKYKTNFSHTTLTGTIEPIVATPGSVAHLTITAEPAADWHIYALADKDPKDVSKPTLIVLTNTTGLRYRAPKPSSPPVEEATTVNQAGKVLYYDKPVSWTIDLEIPHDAKPGKYDLAGIIGYQTCEATACDMPSAANFVGSITVGPTATAGSSPILFREGKYNEAAKLAETAADKSADIAPQSPKTAPPISASNNSPPPSSSSAAMIKPQAIEETTGFDESQIAQNVQSKFSIGELLFGAFFGGILLNLMPCVFPVIGLKILSFVEQSHHHRSRLLVLNLWYSLGVVGVFLGLAAVAVVLREAAGIDFKYGSQNGIQGYAIGMAAVMFVMGLSLLGVWEIPIPGFLGSKQAGKAMLQEGAVGAVAKGAITTLLGASCSAPVVAVAFAFALDRATPIWATFGTFALIGLGMSSPYLILGAYPKLLRFLPKPGAWMDTFKHVCGFILLGATVWVLTWLKMPYVTPTVAFLIGLWAACWWIGRVPFTESTGKRLKAWASASVFAVAIGFFAFAWLAPAMLEKFDDHVSAEIAKRLQATPGGIPQASQVGGSTTVANDRLPWQPFSKDALKQLTRDGKTVMVDFTADWCPNCKALEHFVLNTSEVKSVIDRNGVVPLVADYTNIPPEITDMLTLLKAGGVPVLAIFPADNPNHPIVFGNGLGTYTKQSLIEALEKAGPSRSLAAMNETALK